MSDKTELTPCPFCAKADMLLVGHVEGTIIHPAYHIRCDNCGAVGPTTDKGNHAELWNRRAAIQPTAVDPAAWMMRATDPESDRDRYFTTDRKAVPFGVSGIEITPLAPVAPADAVRDAEDLQRYREINTPEIADFVKGVEREALHQRERWSTSHDAGKAPEDWFWLLGYLGGKALHAAKTGDTDKALHHTISSAAALLNWHAAIIGAHSAMRPGIEPPTDTPKEPAK